MDSAREVDLARREAPAQQVLNSALGAAAYHRNDLPPVTSEEQPPGSLSAHTLQGATATTTQAKLKPKSLADRSSSSTNSGDQSGGSFEMEGFGESTNVTKLQPMDQGFGAWSYVASAFAMYIVVWGKVLDQKIALVTSVSTDDLSNIAGYPQSFPIFHTYLSSGETAKHPDSVVLPLLSPGLQDIQEGFLFQLFPKSTRYRQSMVVSGIFIMMSAVFLASCATTPWQIVTTQGILFGIGGVMLNYVHVSVFPEWFDKKQGQAMGIIWLGFRLGALAFPLICQWLLEQHGFEKTLRVLIAPMLALLLPSTLLLRGRFSAATIEAPPAQPPVSKLTVIRNPTVLYTLLASLLFDLVMNVPRMFITSYAAAIRIKAADQALALSLLALSDMVGTYALGALSDNVSYQVLMAVCAILTSLAHFLLWGFAKTKLGVFVYAIAVGLTSGGKYTIAFLKFS